MTRKRLLITGASGFLGWNVCRAACSRYTVFGVYNTRPCESEGVVPVHGDLRQPSSIDAIFEQIWDSVLPTHSASDLQFCPACGATFP